MPGELQADIRAMSVAMESLQCWLKCQFSSAAMQLEEAVGEFGWALRTA